MDKNSISAADNMITQSETQQTLSGSRTGIWKLIAHKDGKTDMIFDDVMSDMMGFDRNAPSQDNISRLTERNFSVDWRIRLVKPAASISSVIVRDLDACGFLA